MKIGKDILDTRCAVCQLQLAHNRFSRMSIRADRAASLSMPQSADVLQSMAINFDQNLHRILHSFHLRKLLLFTVNNIS